MDNDNIKLTIASNLIRLRTKANMTQADLGRELNYSDKSVSKWERAESVPDICVLKQIADMFNVTVNDLITSNDKWEPKIDKESQKNDKAVNHSIIILISVVGIFSLAFLVFIILWIFQIVQWQIFIYVCPPALITALVMNSIWKYNKGNIYIIMLLVLSIIATVFISIPTRPWQLFLLAIPAELIVILSFNVVKKKSNKTH